ncbi:MAG: hypothetical protein ACP5OV_03110 [Acidimicrobiales bacterium]
MAGGLGLGHLAPQRGAALGRVQVDATSLPIAVGLLVMMYPVLAKVRYGDMGSVAREGRLLVPSLFLHRVVDPLAMYLLAWALLGAIVSAGSELADAVNPVAEVLARRGLSTPAERPGTSASRRSEADIVVTMGCGETCPFVPGRRYEDWMLEDPAGQSVEVVERIVSAIDAHVRAQLLELGMDR